MNNDSLPDKKQRELVEEELNRTMLVEAAAGTGKTTCMINRMVALLARGKCRVHNLAAVTFTRKSAAELRSRFQIGLEQALRQADGAGKQNLSRALSHVERCFIGTIHSFCARLLRERPVEAEVDPAFEEIDEIEDMRLRKAAWDEYVAKLYADANPILAETVSLGIEINQLRPSFEIFADYPDVDKWPRPDVEPPNFDEVRSLLQEVAQHAADLELRFPLSHTDWDELMRKYARVRRMLQHRDLGNPLDLVAILEQFRSVRLLEADAWSGGEKEAKEAKALWEDFRKRGREYLYQWRKHCYPTCVILLHGARTIYDRMRHGSGRLNYQDLLIKAAALLKDKPAIRQYFRDRFTHLLVDEFQDTDPVQAQVMMFLTADDPGEANWQECRPVTGSLFVVGDPKQSIYRFRRADIVTYNKVKSIIAANGLVVTLRANFRSTVPLLNWVNEVFQDKFAREESLEAPVYVALESGRPQIASGVPSVQRLQIPSDIPTDEICMYEADAVARYISESLTSRVEPADRQEELKPGDFMIITQKTKNLAVYGKKLQEYGVPYQVTGGKAVNQSPELALLHRLLFSVIRPDDPVALVGVLRSELFGTSDSTLYHFKRAGGSFSYKNTVPGGLAAEDQSALADAFARLKQYAHWFKIMPPLAAIERLVADIGLEVLCSIMPDGNDRAGSLMKALELLRKANRETWTVTDLVDYLGNLVQGFEKHDSIPALPDQGSAVQVMNLHKAKGLEAPFVFLADPTGESAVRPVLHVDRSGDEVRGYMVLQRTLPNGLKLDIAVPEDWEILKDRETKFEKAELVRLRYVAATRAGRQLTITQRERQKGRGNQHNPWKFFQNYLSGCAVLAESGPIPRPADRPAVISGYEVSQALTGIRQQWEEITTSTYLTAAAKAVSVAPVTSPAYSSKHGTEWGSVIHSLLQVAMKDSGVNLEVVAQSALEEQGMDLDLVQQALETVQSVMRSEIWKRALESRQRLVEVPFQTLMPAIEDNILPTPTVLRGVIDLAFLEPDGWVVVDYKTDRTPGHQVRELVERYTGQVLLYAKVWTEITAQPVQEAGIYFTHSGTYVTCSLP